jgi:hypothetical protein
MAFVRHVLSTNSVTESPTLSAAGVVTSAAIRPSIKRTTLSGTVVPLISMDPASGSWPPR